MKKTHEYELRLNWRHDRAEIIIHRNVVPTNQAETALELARHLSIVAADVDGEDTAGRQKLRLLTPAQVASRAAQIAEALWAEFEQRDWLLALPGVAELREADEKAAAEAKAAAEKEGK